MTMVGSRPFALNEPAYIRLERYPPPVNAQAVGSEQSPMTSSLRGEETETLSGKVALLSVDPVGSRWVQDALEKAPTVEEQEALAKEIHGRAVNFMKNAHANHVLQKCISTMPAESLQFMVDELQEREGLAVNVAKHRYGGRIVQQLLKKCPAAQVSGLAEALMQDGVTLCCATFGTYSMQHLMQFGTEEQQHRLAQMVAENVETIGRSPAGSGVVAAALEHAATEDKVLIAKAALHEPGLLGNLAQGRHSYRAVPEMLELLDEVERAEAQKCLVEDLPALRAARYGRAVAKYLEEKMGLDTPTTA